MVSIKAFATIFVSTLAAAAVLNDPRINSRDLVPYRLLGDELDKAFEGSNFLKELEVVNFNSTNGLERRQASKTFAYVLGGAAISGYVGHIAVGNVEKVYKHCLSNDSDGTFYCLTNSVRLVCDAAIVAALGYTTYNIRVVDVAQGENRIQNIFNIATGGAAEDDVVEDSGITHINKARSQPCPNHNNRSPDWHAGLPHFSGGNYGFKVSCKRSCHIPPAGYGNIIHQLLLKAAEFMIVERGALDMQFTLHFPADDNMVTARCSVELETVPTNTCAVPITGNTCHF